MKDKKILVVGGGRYLELAQEIGPATINVVKFFVSPEKFRLVFFTGGSDIDPELYGHEQCIRTHTNPFRDYIEQQIFDLALKHNIPMVGVCRGLQWLTVMDGGHMIQHTTDHARFTEHNIKTYRKTQFPVNSFHHQMVMPRENAYIICASPKLSRLYIVGKNQRWKEGPAQEIESAYFPDINAFGVQWHPEMLKEKHPARDFFVEHTNYLLSSELEEKLKSNNCPTQGDLESIGNRVKYKKRYRLARIMNERRKKNDQAVRDGEV
jgi:anthranilate/para-aminobenzoate synthase component II